MEEFFKSYQHTISALMTIGTFAAVIVAIWGLRQSKVKLKPYLSFYKNQGADDAMVCIKIINTGLVSAFIHDTSCCYLLTSFNKRKFLPGNGVGGQKKEIPARDREDVDLLPFKEFIKEFNLGDKCWCKRVKAKFKLRWLLYVVTLDGRKFRVKFSKLDRERLKNLLASNSES